MLLVRFEQPTFYKHRFFVEDSEFLIFPSFWQSDCDRLKIRYFSNFSDTQHNSHFAVTCITQ